MTILYDEHHFELRDITSSLESDAFYGGRLGRDKSSISYLRHWINVVVSLPVFLQ